MNDVLEQEEQQEPEQSMRDVMEAAIADVDAQDEAENEGGASVEETPKITETETENVARANTQGAGSADGAATQEGGTGEVKAPVSWSPALREEFGKLPPTVQQQINKRELEITRSLNDGAEARKFGDKMTQTLQPYQSIMAAHGTSDPVAAVNGLMQTAATLQMGSPQQKAEKLAEMINHYGVDIATLDNALSGQPVVDPQQSQLEQLLEQKLAPMQQFMSTIQQTQQQSQQQTQQQAASEVQQFEQQAEFISDVRNDMADLLEMAANRGQQMTLQEAYDKAVALNPEISQVLSQRQADEQLLSNTNRISQKRQAGSSIVGNRVGVNSAPQDDSIEALLNRAWDDQIR